MPAKDWDELPTEEKRVMLSRVSASNLAKQFGRPTPFFHQAKKFFDSLPEEVNKPSQEVHYPPKDLITSARRDLSFYEANFELIDNSLDEWRRRGAKKDLLIEIDYDLDLLTGVFKDNAGGMDNTNVYRVFIPGETANKDLGQNVIGSFGMGAKKGIFRLTDGARVVSSPNGKVSYTSEVPEKWELEKSWATLDGTAKPIPAGETHIYFFKLFYPPTQTDLDELRQRTGLVYSPLLNGQLGKLAGDPKGKLQIKINGVNVTTPTDIRWASPEGAEPHTYEFSSSFPNPMGGERAHMRFILRCGILTKQPGSTEGKESDFGIDVYGNGRLIERHLQEPFGYGTTGLSKRAAATQFVRGKLFIIGHSIAIPWDTHKREYLRDHPVSLWLYDQVRTVVKAYASAASKFTDKGTIEARKELSEKRFDPSIAKPTIKVPVGQGPSEDVLPKLSQPVKLDPVKPSGKKKLKKQPAGSIGSGTGDNGSDDFSAAELADAKAEFVSITLDFDPAEYDDLCGRFGVISPEELQDNIRDCLTGGIVFGLDDEQLAAAIKKFKCENGVSELSEKIRDLLLQKLGY